MDTSDAQFETKYLMKLHYDLSWQQKVSPRFLFMANLIRINGKHSHACVKWCNAGVEGQVNDPSSNMGGVWWVSTIEVVWAYFSQSNHFIKTFSTVCLILFFTGKNPQLFLQKHQLLFPSPGRDGRKTMRVAHVSRGQYMSQHSHSWTEHSHDGAHNAREATVSACVCVCAAYKWVDGILAGVSTQVLPFLWASLHTQICWLPEGVRRARSWEDQAGRHHENKRHRRLIARVYSRAIFC